MTPKRRRISIPFFPCSGSDRCKYPVRVQGEMCEKCRTAAEYQRMAERKRG